MGEVALRGRADRNDRGCRRPAGRHDRGSRRPPGPRGAVALLFALAFATGACDRPEPPPDAGGDAAAASTTGAGAAGAPERAGAADAPPAAAPAPPQGPPPRVRLEIEDHGEVVLELYPDKAPRTVANFIELAGSGFYDGTTFHRVVPGFVIQGGDPNSRNRDPRDDGKGGPGYTIPSETNDLRHQRGVLSMANRGRPDTAGSQFFVVLDDHPELDGGYTAFGRVVEGMDVVDAIAEVDVDRYGRHGPIDRPREDVRIATAQVLPPAAGPDDGGGGGGAAGREPSEPGPKGPARTEHEAPSL